MRSLNLSIILRTHDDMNSKNTTRQWKNAFSYLADMLPGLRSIRVRVLVVLGRVAPWHAACVVARGLDILRPFKACKGLEIVLHEAPERDAHKTEILTELKRRVEVGEWT